MADDDIAKVMAALEAEQDQDEMNAYEWFETHAPTQVEGVIRTIARLCEHDNPFVGSAGRFAQFGMIHLYQKWMRRAGKEQP